MAKVLREAMGQVPRLFTRHDRAAELALSLLSGPEEEEEWLWTVCCRAGSGVRPLPGA